MSSLAPDAQLLRWLEKDGGYMAVRKLPDGSIAALGRLLTTDAVFLGVNRRGWSRRFCFQDRPLARQRFEELQSEDDDPAGYIAKRP